MTQIIRRIVECARCGDKSPQILVCSVNFSLGSKEDNEKLMKHLQKCPNCGYEAVDISKKEDAESK